MRPSQCDHPSADKANKLKDHFALEAAAYFAALSARLVSTRHA
jgi:hypothetical protein